MYTDENLGVERFKLACGVAYIRGAGYDIWSLDMSNFLVKCSRNLKML